MVYQDFGENIERNGLQLRDEGKGFQISLRNLIFRHTTDRFEKLIFDANFIFKQLAVILNVIRELIIIYRQSSFSMLIGNQSRNSLMLNGIQNHGLTIEVNV